MKFSCEKSHLLEAINTVSRAVSNKTTIAILEGIRITAGENLTFTGYNLSIGIQTTLPADIIQTGELIINAKLFGDIVRKFPEDVVYFETDEKMITKIHCGRAMYHLSATSAEEYPTIPEVTPHTTLQITENKLKMMINRTVFAVSENQSKPIHTGCLFETTEQQLTVVAVDGFRLAIRREQLQQQPDTAQKFVVPGLALREVEHILSEDEDKIVEICPGDRHILFRIGQTTFVTRLIDGEFLNYKAAIPSNSKFKITAETQSISRCLERVSLMLSAGAVKNPIRVCFNGEIINMTCITVMGKSYDECTIDGSVEEMEIGFNNRYLADALRACAQEKISMSLSGPLHPLLMEPLEGNDYTYLVLPVRLKADA